jgi:hypothetical protein
LPLLIVGNDALTRVDSSAILNTTKIIANAYKFINSENGWNGFNILHRNQGQINALELGIDFKPIAHDPKIIFLLGCDNNISSSDIPKNSFVVYIVLKNIFRDRMEIKGLNMQMLFCLRLPILKEAEHMVRNILFS